MKNEKSMPKVRQGIATRIEHEAATGMHSLRQRIKALQNTGWEFVLSPQETKFLNDARFKAISMFQGTSMQFVELTGIVPRGLDTHLGATSAHKVLHGCTPPLDVIADPTRVLSLQLAEIVRQNGAIDSGTLELSTVSNVVRLQPYQKKGQNGYRPVFWVLALASAKTNTRRTHVPYPFVEHVKYNLQFIQQLTSESKAFPELIITLSNLSIYYDLVERIYGYPPMHEAHKKIDIKNYRTRIKELLKIDTLLLPVIDALKIIQKNNLGSDRVRKFKWIYEKLTPSDTMPLDVMIDLGRISGRGHYRMPDAFTFMIGIPKRDDKQVIQDIIDISDGGEVTWTADLLSNQKIATVVSGTGITFLHYLLTEDSYITT